VTIVWEQYEGMPHTFPTDFPNQETSNRCTNPVGYFAHGCVEGDVKTRAAWIAMKTGEESPIRYQHT
jgi:hypothetical protein